MPVFEGKFASRRNAEMTIERLVQEFDIDRRAIKVAPKGATNSVGDELVGSDAAASSSSPARQGEIIVTVDVHSDAAAKVRAAFQEFSGDPT